MSSEVVLKVQNVGKRYEMYEAPHHRLLQTLLRGRKQFYKEFWALKDVSFEVNKGETVGIIGRNGSGKSTLLQMICGTLNPTSGNIQINGRVAALLELGSGFNPEFTGRENVYLNASVLGLRKGEVDERFDDIAAFADIGDFIDQPVKTYSSGMCVRLAFAVIVHVDADILVIDEALSVGDVFFTQKCMRFLRKFMEKGTVLFVSHDTSAVINLCNHSILLQDGKIKSSGTPKEVTDLYLEELYKTLQEVVKFPVNSRRILDEKAIPVEFHDMRRDFINTTKLRNDIEVFDFSSNADSFGAGVCSITSICLEDCNGRPLSWIIGGELVRLRITTRLSVEIPMLLFGFIVKDRLGQYLFGDNTHIRFIDNPLNGKANEEWAVRFTFRMPILPTGEYSVDVAVGNGMQEDHVIQQWIYDALVFRSHASSTHMGLMGIPMFDISANAISSTKQ
jgi:lipopolysaccharide transport system ATP-binding protein